MASPARSGGNMFNFIKTLTRSVVLAALSVACVATAQAQDLGSPTTVTFSFGSTTGIPNPHTESGFTFTYSGATLASDAGGGESGTSGIFGFDDNPNETIRIDYSGNNFDFNSFWYDNQGAATNLTVTGHNSSGTEVARDTFNSYTGASTLTMTDSGFNSVDHVIIQASAGFNSGVLDTFAFGVPVAPDTTPPAVQSITVSGSPAAGATSVTFSVDFDETANNVSTDDFTLTTVSGSATGSISSVSASSGDPISVTVNSISGTGVIRLDLNGGTNISDASANSGPSAFTSGSTHTVDRDAPSAPSTPDMTAGTDTGTSNTDNLTSDTTPTFTGTSEANATITVSSSASGSLGTTTANGAGNWSFTPGGALSAGAQTITATATDAAGNVSSASSGLSITIDASAPSAPSTPDMTAASDLGASDTDNVTSDTTPTFTGTSEANATVTVISSADGTLGVTTSDGSGNWTYTSGALSAGSHTITATATDASGNVSSASSGLAISIDVAAPTVTSIVRQTPAAQNTNADSVVFRVAFAEAVTAVEAADFSVSGPSGASIGVVAASALIYDVTISGGDMASLNATVDLGFAGGQDITDTAGNALSNTTPGSEETYTLDNTAPSGYSVTLDQDPVNSGNQGAASFTFASAEVGAGYSYTITSSGGAGSVSNTGTISTATDQITSIDVSGLPDGTLTLSVTLTDPAGNAGSAATDTTTKEAQAPQVNSITLAGSPAGNATSVTFTVAFTEAASNITTDDFSLTTTGSAAGTIASVSSSSGTSVTVTVNSISGAGTIRLDLDAATDIQDASGNSGPNAYTSGAVHTVDSVAPAAFGIAWQDALITAANQAATDIRFTTAEVGTTYAYTVTDGAAATVTGTAAITTATQDVTIDVSGLANGTLTLTATLTDAGGNVTNQTAAATVTKSATPPAFSMAFSPTTSLVGQASTLTYTIDNSAGLVSASSLAFSHSLSAGLAISTPPNASTTCTGGSVTAVAGAGTVSYSGGSVNTGASCTVQVDVSSASVNTYSNTTGALTSNLGNSGTASASLTVSQPVLSVSDASVVEGNTGTSNLNFTVTLAPASPQTITVDYATSDGTALSASDYTAATGTLTFAPSETTKTVTVTVAGDAVIEPNETLVLTLSNPGNATLGDATATGTITTDDVAETDTTAPLIASINRGSPLEARTNADSLSWSVEFSESVVGVGVDDFVITGPALAPLTVSGSGSAYQVTASGGDLAQYNGAVALQLSDGAIIRDSAGNALANRTPANSESYLLDNAGPVATLSADVTEVFEPFTVSITFDEAVSGFEVSDLVIVNATSGPLLTRSETEFSLQITPPVSGSLSISLPADRVTDDLGNANLASDALSLDVDESAPVLTSIIAETGLVTNADTVRWSVEFNEAVTGVDASSFEVSGVAGAVISVSGSGSAYQVAASGSALADLDGDVQLSVSAQTTIEDLSGIAFEGEGPTGVDESSVRLDNTAPVAQLTTESSEVTGPFDLALAFNEAVSTPYLSALSVENGAASTLTQVNARTYTVRIAPETYGEVAISLAAGAVVDEAGNASAASDLSLQAVAEDVEVEVEVDIDQNDPVGVAATARVTNPGTELVRFRASVDVDWLTVTPLEGVIPAQSDIDFSVSVNDLAAALNAGSYTGTVTIVREAIDGSASTASAGASGPRAVEEVVLARFPITLVLTTRKGAVQLLTTTPAGVSGDADFVYASSVSAFDGLQLSTVNGQAQSASVELDEGVYEVRQSAPAGWRLEAVSCAGDLDGGSTADLTNGVLRLDLDPGETLVCTFENARDEDVVRLATQRAIRNFMLRRADRIIDAAPDLSTRLGARNESGAGLYSADVDRGRYNMSLTASLSGARNQAKARHADAPGMPSHMRDEGRLDVWLSAEISGVTDNRAGDRAESDFGVAQLGADWALSDDLLIGGMVQFDWMDETAREVFEEAGAIAGARVDGEGWMAGPYMVWRLADRVIFDGLAMYGTSSNTVNPLGLYEDEFETDRWMVRANLTGEYARGPWMLRPQATLTHFEETQDAYADSLGISIPGQSVELGRLSAGPELIWRHERSNGARWELSSRVRAVWDYQPADLLTESGLFADDDSEFRADGELGVSAILTNGAIVQVSVGLSGIGQSDFEANSARFNVRFPLSLGQ
jgi:hypothetical protein